MSDLAFDRLEAYILDTNFLKVGFVKNYVSFIWTDRFCECGDFEIVVPLNEENLKLYKQDYYIACNRSEKVMIIESIQTTVSPEDGDQMLITGRSLESILERRVIVNEVNYDGNYSPSYNISDSQIINCIGELIRANCSSGYSSAPRIMYSGNNYTPMSPVNQNRELPIDYIGNPNGNETINLPDILLTGVAEYSGIGSSVLDAVTDICNTNGIGFKILCDFETGRFKMFVYDGDDHTNDVFFSIEKKNLISYDTTDSVSDTKNYIYVKGETYESSSASSDLSNVNVGSQYSNSYAYIDDNGNVAYTRSLEGFNAGANNAGKFLVVGNTGRITYTNLDNYDGDSNVEYT